MERDMKVQIRDIDGPIGADVTGIDFRAPLANEDRRAIEDAFVRRLVLRFRDAPLTPSELCEFSRHFGELQPHIAKRYRHPEAPDVVLMVNQDEKGNFDRVGAERGVGWHSDLAYEQAPAKATFLHAVAIPDRGGNTKFANMYMAYETMPDELRSRIDGKYARFRQGGRLALNQGIMDKQTAKSDVVHPVVRTHPDSRRKSVYANPYHTVSIIGMSPADSDALLDELYEWCSQERFQWQQVWQVADTIMWENRSAWHSGSLDYPIDQLRKFYRTTVRGIPTVEQAEADRLLAVMAA
jgi:taurine dioxygenase